MYKALVKAQESTNTPSQSILIFVDRPSNWLSGSLFVDISGLLSSRVGHEKNTKISHKRVE